MGCDIAAALSSGSSSRLGEPRERRSDELAQVVRDRPRLTRRPVARRRRARRAISSAKKAFPAHDWCRRRSVGLGMLQPRRCLTNSVERCGAEWFEPEAVGPVEPRRRGVFGVDPGRGQGADRSTVQPTTGEGERAGRGTVEPLHVVDRDERRSIARERAQDRRESREDGARVGRRARSPPVAAARPRSRRAAAPEARRALPSSSLGEDVREACIRERGVGLGRAARRARGSRDVPPNPRRRAKPWSFRSLAHPRAGLPPIPRSATRGTSRDG